MFSFLKKIFRNKSKILFSTKMELIDAFPHPIPAHKAMPKWFKELKPNAKSQSKAETGTSKKCIPMLDAMSQGYIIPLWADLHVKVTKKTLEKDGEEGLHVWMKFPSDWSTGDLSTHSWEQVGDACDLKKFELGKVILKFANPWSICTPKGWSVQLKNPSNNFENNILLFEGVVDTDTYQLPINFPYIWTGNEEGEWVIPKGTPLVQVIPFKREKLKLVTGIRNDIAILKMNNKLSSLFQDRYKNLFWHKRKQK